MGPPGAGKTTTLVKLAVHYGLTSRRPVALLSTDTYRVAAAEQLRSYAAILGVAFQVVETVGALAQSLEEHRAKDLILIDTPGSRCRPTWTMARTWPAFWPPAPTSTRTWCYRLR